MPERALTSVTASLLGHCQWHEK